jgi:hypothetical protein
MYLGDTGIFYRQVSAAVEAMVPAEGPVAPVEGPVEPAPGTLLYTF